MSARRPYRFPVAIDGSPGANHATEYVTTRARSLRACDVHLVMVRHARIQELPTSAPREVLTETRGSRRMLDRAGLACDVHMEFGRAGARDHRARQGAGVRRNLDRQLRHVPGGKPAARLGDLSFSRARLELQKAGLKCKCRRASDIPEILSSGTPAPGRGPHRDGQARARSAGQRFAGSTALRVLQLSEVPVTLVMFR